MLNNAVSSSPLPNLQAPRAPQPANGQTGQAGAPTAADEAPDAFARQLAQAQSAKAAAANATAARAAQAAREAQDRLAREAAAPRTAEGSKPAAEARPAATEEPDAEATEGATRKTGTDTDADPAAWLASLLPGGAERLARGGLAAGGAENGGPGGRRSAGIGTGKAAPGSELAGRIDGADAAQSAGAGHSATGGLQAGAGDAAGRFAAALAEAGQKAEAAAAPAAQRSEATAPAADAVRALAAADGTTPTAASAPAEASAPTPPFTAHLAAAIDSPAFAPALGAQVSLLVRDGIQQARLELNPAEMGPISVQIDLNGTQAHVSFGADLAATRSALETSLPDLAAALSTGGFTLAGGGVFAQNPGAGGQPGRDEPGRTDRGLGGVRGAAGADDMAALAPAQPLRAARGVVDLVA